jgi:hypothetical protein
MVCHHLSTSAQQTENIHGRKWPNRFLLSSSKSSTIHNLFDFEVKIAQSKTEIYKAIIPSNV